MITWLQFLNLEVKKYEENCFPPISKFLGGGLIQKSNFRVCIFSEYLANMIFQLIIYLYTEKSTVICLRAFFRATAINNGSKLGNTDVQSLAGLFEYCQMLSICQQFNSLPQNKSPLQFPGFTTGCIFFKVELLWILVNFA